MLIGRLFIATVLFTALVECGTLSQAQPAPTATESPVAEKISSDATSNDHSAIRADVLTSMPLILKDMKYLADDEREGRGPGSEGIEEASQYIHQAFLNAGLTMPPQDMDGFLDFSVKKGSSLGTKNSLEFTFADGSKIVPVIKQDYQVLSMGGSGKVQGEIVFCGYGIDAPQHQYSDFNQTALNGKIALVIRRVPKQSEQNGPFTKDGAIDAEFASLTYKIKQLSTRHAAAIFIVNDPHTIHKTITDLDKEIEESQKKQANESLSEDEKKGLNEHIQQLEEKKQKHQGDELVDFGYGGPARGNPPPVIQLTNQLANQLLLKSMGKNLEQIEQEIDRDFKPLTQSLSNITVQCETEINQQSSTVHNVIGVLEGNHKYGEETIIVGAHYDHVGRGAFGSLLPGTNQVHNGADDNASGTCALLEIVRKLSQHKEQLPRRIVFIAFAAEEMGLLGSVDYVAHPMYPLDQTIAMFNFDMVGRVSDNKITIFGDKTSPQWDPLLDQLAARHELNLVLKPEGFGPSDHSSFYSEKIPVLHFFSGLHGDYHRPSDDWDKINIQGISRIAQFTEEILIDTAMLEKRPEYTEIKGRANVFNAAGKTPYFGTIPDLSYTGPGYKLADMLYDSPAKLAGFQKGDIIQAIGHQKIDQLLSLPEALSKFQAGQTVTVDVDRDGKTLQIFVKLDKPR
jgi:hypothetical protein